MFRQQFPHGVITTEEILVDLDRGYARYKATVADGAGGHATGYGTETQADFADFCERAETRAVGRALALAGFGTQFVGQDLTEGGHVADAPVATTPGPLGTVQSDDGHGDPPPEDRISQDQARELKKVAQTVFGYVEGERRLRHDLGFEPDEKLTLRHLAAHVTATQYATVMTTYDGLLRQQVEVDVPDHSPPAEAQAAEAPAEERHPQTRHAFPEGASEPEPPETEDRERWYRLSRRSMQAGVLPSVWEALRAGEYADAERVILALEAPTTGAEGRGVDG
jgi:hypothetical protein